jgi:DNA-binding MarR family transcriptional regulator
VDQASELRYLILGAQREGNRGLTAALAPADVTPSQAEVLGVLRTHGSLTLRALGDHLICESGSPSRLVATMVRAGLVERTAHHADGRAVLLGLTQRGEHIAEHCAAIDAAIADAITGALTPAALNAAVQALRVLVAGLPVEAVLARRGAAATSGRPSCA